MTALTLAADGTDVETFGWIDDISPWVGLPGLRGANLTVPTRPGDLLVRKTVAAHVRTLSLNVHSRADDDWTPAQLQSALRDLRRLLFKPFTLTRTVTFDDTGVVESSASAEAIPSAPAVAPGGTSARWAVDLNIVDGLFYGDPVSIVVPDVATVFTVEGDDTTHNMTITLPGRGVLVNATLGVELTVGLVSGPVTVDVLGWTVSGGGGPGDVATTGDELWFALAPGANSLHWVPYPFSPPPGHPTIDYRPAWL